MWYEINHNIGQLQDVSIRPKPSFHETPQQNSPQTPAHLSKQVSSSRPPSFAVEVVTPSRVQRNSYTPQPTVENGCQTPAGDQAAAAFTISVPPRKFDLSQYSTHIDLDYRMRQTKPVGTTATSKSRKRKRSSSEGDDEPMTAGIDQRAKADSHVRSLEVLISGIFEAEDNLQPDTSERAIEKTNKYWMSGTLENGLPCLSSAMQIKLENSIHRVVGVGRFTAIPVEDLTRLQKLCESTLKLAEETSVKVDEGSIGDETSLDSWLGRLGTVDNGLKTAKTVLRIMVGGRDEKQVGTSRIKVSGIS